eukprot:3307145-Karenia_brevis.AAC.1
MVVCTDWHEWFRELAGRRQALDPEFSDTLKEIKASSRDAALAAFADSHNTGYYVKSYTTKLNPTMDGVLSKLMDS